MLNYLNTGTSLHFHKICKDIISLFSVGYAVLSSVLIPNSAYTNIPLSIAFSLMASLCSTLFGPKGDEVTGDSRKSHNEELHNSYSLPSIIRMIESRRMRWAGHVARMGRSGMHIGY
jgi:hypothetical protein